jgi:hypothetical protein
MVLAATILLGGAGVAEAKPPQWDKIISGNGRFKVMSAFGGLAVLDRETGLVWERNPTSATGSYGTARHHRCLQKTVGGRMGWRLPTTEEFTSLADASGPGPVLPAGHPFTFTPWDYWTSSTLDGSPSVAIVVNPVDFSMKFTEGKDGSNGFWCVRGGQGFDGVD